MSELLKQLSKLSAAEEFLDFLGVEYDQHIVNVNRLHILKRFQQYMAATPYLKQADDGQMHATCKKLLTNAYHDFVQSTAQREKLFKVFKQNEHSVPITNLRTALTSRRNGG